MGYCKEVYSNAICIAIKYDLITSVGGTYKSEEIYETRNQQWYISTKGYVHFIFKNKDVILTNNCTLKY